ncbi:MAG: hypothetical protein LC687_02925, partial [Actinobacteria bacterium]|nr:hypothetical protein [Actinomycetota bacterium]
GEAFLFDLEGETSRGTFTLDLKNTGGSNDESTFEFILNGNVVASQSVSFTGETISANSGGLEYDSVRWIVNAESGDLKILNATFEKFVIPDAENLVFTAQIEDADGDVDTEVFSVSINYAAPIAIDLDNDGVEYLSRDAGVVFTDESTGESVNTAWVAPDDGLLVIDADGSGTVNASKEYVFTEWSETAETDMEAVREVFDTNNNGMLDQGDEAWSQFAVWQDANSDGKTDEGEMVSLGELGVESIALTYTEESEARTDADGDVLVHGQSQVTWTDGSVSIAEDTGFALNALDVLSGDDEIQLPAGDEGGSPTVVSNPATSTPAAAIPAVDDLAAMEFDLMLSLNDNNKPDPGYQGE